MAETLPSFFSTLLNFIIPERDIIFSAPFVYLSRSEVREVHLTRGEERSVLCVLQFQSSRTERRSWRKCKRRVKSVGVRRATGFES